MKNSINYLYDKAEKSNLTPLLTDYSTHSSSDDFHEHVDFLQGQYEHEKGIKTSKNNLYRHIVLALHPSEVDTLLTHKDEMLADLFEDIGIDVFANSINAFIHTDESHPHIHIAFTRVNDSGKAFNDSKIGERLGKLAEKYSIKYELKNGNSNRLYKSRKELYKPTTKGKLKDLINFSRNNSESMEEYFFTLKKHGVNISNKNNSLSYLIPTNVEYSKDEYDKIIKESLAFKSFSLQKEFLLTKNIYLKIHQNKKVYSLQKFISFKDSSLGDPATFNNLQKHFKHYSPNVLLNKQIAECSCLKDLKNLFPNSKITYKRDGAQLKNIQVHSDQETIYLKDLLTADIKIEEDYVFSEQIDDLMPIQMSHPSSWDGLDEYLEYLNKNKKKKQIGMKVKIK